MMTPPVSLLLSSMHGSRRVYHKFRFICLQMYEISTAFLSLRSVKERVGSSDADGYRAEGMLGVLKRKSPSANACALAGGDFL